MADNKVELELSLQPKSIPTNSEAGTDESTNYLHMRHMAKKSANDINVGSLNETIEHKDPEYKDDTIANRWRTFREQNRTMINKILIALLNVVVGGYFAWATYHFIHLKNNYYEIEWPPVVYADDENGTTTVAGHCPTYCGFQWCDGYGMLIVLLAFVYAILFYFQIVKRFWGKQIQETILRPVSKRFTIIFHSRFSKVAVIGLCFVGLMAFVIVDNWDSLHQLQSLSGIFTLLAIGWLFSKDRSKIKYQPVICGFGFQFLLGLFCIRWEVGRSIFQCAGNKIAVLLNYAKDGSVFVYGDFLVNEKAVFAFSVLSVIFFVSFIISILFYWGAMQWIVMKLGWILQSILGTTVCESVIAAANIFLGMSESPLLIRPYIKYLTHSELHAIMTSGYATVSGSVLAAYIWYGAEPSHLVTSSVMAAPAALCFSKLFYPETEESKTKSGNMVLEKSNDTSVLDAASNGATLAISLVLGIGANLIAFVSFVAFLNGVVNWFGFLVGFDDLTFEFILAKLFIPLAWVIGVPWYDCENVAELIATKTIINEFVAYERLGKMKLAGLISLRSSAIATYAVCGFANPSSLGIMIAALSAMAPEKRSTITDVAIRALIAGSIVCFITASIAALLLP